MGKDQRIGRSKGERSQDQSAALKLVRWRQQYSRGKEQHRKYGKTRSLDGN